MKKIFLSLSLVLTCLALIGCGAEVSSNEGPKGNISVVVMDAYNALVDNAEVTLLQGGGDTKKTTNNGNVTFFGLDVGSYSLTVKKTGYAPMIISTDILIDGTAVMNEKATAKSITLSVNLMESGMSVSGRAVILVNGATTLVPNATLVLTISSSGLLNNKYTATTNAGGEFLFTDLPKGVGYNISSLIVTINAIEYVATTKYVSSVSDEYTTEIDCGDIVFVKYDNKAL